jgi:hypothetical protein
MDQPAVLNEINGLRQRVFVILCNKTQDRLHTMQLFSVIAHNRIADVFLISLILPGELTYTFSLEFPSKHNSVACDTSSPKQEILILFSTLVEPIESTFI